MVVVDDTMDDDPRLMHAQGGFLTARGHLRQRASHSLLIMKLVHSHVATIFQNLIFLVPTAFTIQPPLSFSSFFFFLDPSSFRSSMRNQLISGCHDVPWKRIALQQCSKQER